MENKSYSYELTASIQNKGYTKKHKKGIEICLCWCNYFSFIPVKSLSNGIFKICGPSMVAVYLTQLKKIFVKGNEINKKETDKCYTVIMLNEETPSNIPYHPPPACPAPEFIITVRLQYLDHIKLVVVVTNVGLIQHTVIVFKHLQVEIRA